MAEQFKDWDEFTRKAKGLPEVPEVCLDRWSQVCVNTSPGSERGWIACCQRWLANGPTPANKGHSLVGLFDEGRTYERGGSETAIPGGKVASLHDYVALLKRGWPQAGDVLRRQMETVSLPTPDKVYRRRTKWGDDGDLEVRRALDTGDLEVSYLASRADFDGQKPNGFTIALNWSVGATIASADAVWRATTACALAE